MTAILPAWVVALADAAAMRHSVPAPILRALLWRESAGRADAVSPAGAIGLAQLMPATAAELGVNPWDPAENVEGGARYLASMAAKFGGDWGAALAAYNAGPGRVARAGWPGPGWFDRLPAETRAYVPAILERAGWTWDALRGLAIGPVGMPPGGLGGGVLLVLALVAAGAFLAAVR